MNIEAVRIFRIDEAFDFAMMVVRRLVCAHELDASVGNAVGKEQFCLPWMQIVQFCMKDIDVGEGCTDEGDSISLVVGRVIDFHCVCVAV